MHSLEDKSASKAIILLEEFYQFERSKGLIRNQMSGVLLTNVMDLNDMSLLYNALIFVWGVVF
jgi:hypothetical protein